MLSEKKKNNAGIEQWLKHISDFELISDSNSENILYPDSSYSECIFFIRNGICIEQNLAAEKTFGYSINEVKDRLFADWIHSDYREKVLKNITKAQEIPFRAETVTRDGKSILCELRSKKLASFKEPVFLVSAKIIDVQNSLLEEHKKTIALLSSAQKLNNVCVWKWESDSKTLFCTNEIESIFKFKVSKAEGTKQIQKIAACYSLEDQKSVIKGLTQSIKHQQTFDYKCQITTVKGNKKCVRLIANAIKEGDKLVSVIGFITNISEMCDVSNLLRTRLNLKRKSYQESIPVFLQHAIDSAEKLSNSSIGFFHFLEDNEKSIRLQAWSTNTLKNKCMAKGLDEHYQISDAGVWVDCIRKRKTVIHNDYKSLPHQKGMPDGHVEIIRELVVPVFRENKIKGILGVGNKPTPYTDEDINMISQLADFVWDFVERMKIENKSKQNFQAFEASFRTSPDAMTIVELDGDFCMLNDKSYELIGRPKKEIKTKKDLLKLEIWRNIDSRKKLLAALKKNDTVKNFEAELKSKNGKIIRVLISATIIKVYDKKCLLTITRDITELKEIKKNLVSEKIKAEEKERQRKILMENSPTGFFLFDPDGNMLEANDAILNIVGSPSKDKTLSMNFLEVDNIINSNIHYNAKKCISEKIPITDETPFVSFWGKKSYLRYSFFPIIKEDKVTSVVANIEDISDLHEMRKKLIEEKKRADESNKLKTVFLRNMSHELRTPMSGIIGFSKLFMKPDLSFEKRKKYAEIVLKSSKQLMGMINDVLDITKIEAGKIIPRYEYINVCELLSDTYFFFINEAQKRNIQLILENNIKDEKCYIKTDNLRLSQVINNLIGNSLKYTKKGYIKFGCELVKKKDNPRIQFFVIDTGVGISKKDQQNIFEPFIQENSVINKNLGGTGLGLSITKNLVSLLGGEIWVESEKDKGASFYFNIPYVTPNLKPESKEKTLSKLTNLYPQITILLAEDQAINYLFIKEIMEDINVSLIHAWDGVEAIKLCKKNPAIKLVLMDLKMPEMNGFEATREIKKQYPDLPVIALTAYAMDEDKLKAKEAGCETLIPKPVDVDNLKKIIDRYRK